MPNELNSGKGLIGSMKLPTNGLMGSGDSTKIPEAIRAIMAKRKATSADTTKPLNMAEELKAIQAGKKGFSDKQRDSLAAKFDHDAYVKHLDEIGYEVVKKKPQ